MVYFLGVDQMSAERKAANLWLNVGLAILVVLGFTVEARSQALPQMKLSDDLDRPGEGYCIDVVGVGSSARTDLPLVVHNCLPDLAREDRHAVYDAGRIVFPAFDMCVTAFGVVSPLAGAAVILRPCGAEERFLPAGRLQQFERTQRGQLQLARTDLCLSAGLDAARTFGASDRWRTLTMQPCDTTPDALSVWD
ncbi:MAG: hypothetical protein AAFQ58_08555 [Pseudomonadota bacterium]